MSMEPDLQINNIMSLSKKKPKSAADLGEIPFKHP